MASVSFEPEPDLTPLYPIPATVSPLLSPNFGLESGQKTQLVGHCLVRACAFGELPLLTYLLRDPQAQPYVDLCIRDEEDIGLISTTILGFGSDSDRDIEREECVRLLLSEGADIETPDKAGWTPLHYAAVLSPPTLVSHFLKSGCSPFAQTRRNLTALDLVTGHSLIPGRETVALLLEEAMRSEGWAGGRMEERRKASEERTARLKRQNAVREDINRSLGLDPSWWGECESDVDSGDADEGETDEAVYTPQKDLGSMLAFSPAWLPEIFHSLITNFPITVRNSEPANALYLLARFACLYCDQAWLEDLIIEATDTIEDTFFDRPDDLSCLVFWLYNTTLWLHLMKCDESINQACEALGSFEMIEEVINSVFVFIIRKAERKIDELLDAALLEHTPLVSELDSVQFESEWSIFRSFGAKKKPPTTPSKRDPPSPPFESGSPLPSAGTPSKSFQQSIRNTFSRGRNGTTTPLHSIFPDSPPAPTPTDITSHLTAFHTFLTLSGINPALITQFWSQVMYWTACEAFNRILTRKKYLCRSRAIQISMNVSVLEEWVGRMGLPRGVQSHFAPVRDLLNWLQCLSSINDFADLIATVQTMRSLNPLQMRRAVRDYKYEVNESRMTEECTQYLAQLQKDWEKHRVRLGVEALRKEMVERDRESLMSTEDDDSTPSLPSQEGIPDALVAQKSVDMLFDRLQGKSSWEPAKPPEALGEFLDSRHMLPLFFPSNPRMLAAFPGKLPRSTGETKPNSKGPGSSETALASVGSRGPLDWTMGGKKVRDVGIGLLAWVDGAAYTSRWTRPAEVEPDEEAERIHDSPGPDDDLTLNPNAPAPLESITPLTRRKSSRRGRSSVLSTGEGDDFGIAS